jgi:hypothetical protein
MTTDRKKTYTVYLSESEAALADQLARDLYLDGLIQSPDRTPLFRYMVNQLTERRKKIQKSAR